MRWLAREERGEGRLKRSGKREMRSTLQLLLLPFARCRCCCCYNRTDPTELRRRCQSNITMVFNGAEAFKGGASAPSLEREVSGKWSPTFPTKEDGLFGDVSVFFVNSQ